MKQIPLEKLTKYELITLINRCDYSGRIKREATSIYYESRTNKNDAEEKNISKAIEANLEMQKKVMPEFNACKDPYKKMKLAAKLDGLINEFKELNKSWKSSYKKGNSIFTECYGSDI